MNTSKNQILVTYAKTYLIAFQSLLNSGELNARERAGEAGKRALSYFIKAQAFDKLVDFFVSDLVSSTQNPQILQPIINELTVVVEQIPKGETHWSVLTYLADALHNNKSSIQALPLYQQAVAEAEAAQNWQNVGWICHNWGSLEDYDGIAGSYTNLAIMLQNAGQTKKATYHTLASILYLLVTDNQQELYNTLRNLAIDIRDAEENTQSYNLPPVSNLLKHPEFSSLNSFIQSFELTAEKLQPKINEIVEYVRNNLYKD